MFNITRELPHLLVLQLSCKLAYLQFKGFDGRAHIGIMVLNAVKLGFIPIKSPFSLHNKCTYKVFNGRLLLCHWFLKTQWWLHGIPRIGIGNIFMVP